MRNKFEEQLSILNLMLIEMGAQIESAIAMAVGALEKQDTALAKRVMDGDDEIDQKEKDIEALCLKLLLRQQPVAGDLRLVSAALKMITDMERIGDQAADIAEISTYLANAAYIKKLEHIARMADVTAGMVGRSIDAFVRRDLPMAKRVVADDDIVDGLFDEVKSELIALIQTDPANAGQAMDLLMIAKYFERVGDHAVNIAEWVEFAITGRHNEEGV